MESMLQEIAHCVVLAIETMAVAMIAFGAVGALAGLARVGMQSEKRRTVWLTFARWLVAGLTFQLAADIVNTSFDPTWDEIGHLAAIAAVRTFLSFFLDREIETKSEQAERRRAELP